MRPYGPENSATCEVCDEKEIPRHIREENSSNTTYESITMKVSIPEQMLESNNAIRNAENQISPHTADPDNNENEDVGLVNRPVLERPAPAGIGNCPV